MTLIASLNDFEVVCAAGDAGVRAARRLSSHRFFNARCGQRLHLQKGSVEDKSRVKK